MKALILALLALPLLAGCLNDYEHYVKAVEAQAKWKATGEIARAEAFKEAVKSPDPVVAAVAANGLGISEALRTAGRGGGGADTPIQPPKTAYDYFALGANFLLGGGQIAASFNATNKGAAVAIEQIRGQVEIENGRSQERVSIFNRFGQTSEALGGHTRDVALGLGNNLEAATKEPRNVTTVNVTGSNNPVAVNGSQATNTQTQIANTNNCPSGNGGTGTPGSSTSTPGETGTTTATTTGTNGAQSGTTGCNAGK